MALTERTRAYETLIRYGANGEIGSQHSTITEVLRDSVIVSAQVNSPQPLTVAELGGIVEAADGAALIELAQVKLTLQEANAAVVRASDEMGTIKETNAAALIELAQVRFSLQEANAAVAWLTDELSKMKAPSTPEGQ